MIDPKSYQRDKPKTFFGYKVPTYIYFALAEELNLIKIGISRSPNTRRSSIKYAVPVELFIICTYPGTKTDESELHHKFWRDHYRSEWFHYSDDIKRFVEKKNREMIKR